MKSAKSHKSKATEPRNPLEKQFILKSFLLCLLGRDSIVGKDQIEVKKEIENLRNCKKPLKTPLKPTFDPHPVGEGEIIHDLRLYS